MVKPRCKPVYIYIYILKNCHASTDNGSNTRSQLEGRIKEEQSRIRGGDGISDGDYEFGDRVEDTSYGTNVLKRSQQ